jgi:hypothetical protein
VKREIISTIKTTESGAKIVEKFNKGKMVTKGQDELISDWLQKNRNITTGETRFLDNLDSHRMNKYRLDHTPEYMEPTSAIGKALNRIINPVYVLSEVDRKLGTKFGTYLHDTSNQLEKFQTVANKYRGELDKLRSEAKKMAGDVDENLSKIFLSIDRGVSLTPELDALAGKYKTLFETMREEAVSLGAAIPKRENYVPYRLLPRMQMMGVLRDMEKRTDLARKLDTVYSGRAGRKKVVELRRGAITDGTDMQVQESEYLRSVEFLTGEKIYTGNQLRSAVSKLESKDPGIARRLNMISTAERIREGTAPNILLNTNIDDVARQWVSNTYRNAMLYRPIRNLKNAIPLLEKAGEDNTAMRISRLVDDISSGVDSMGSKMDNLMFDFENRLQKRIENLEGEGSNQAARALKFLQVMPHALAALRSQIYPNFMGWRIKPVLRNLTQPFGQTATEIASGIGGYGYGVAKVFRGYAYVLALWKNGKLGHFLEEKGLTSSRPFQSLADDANAAMRGAGKFLDAARVVNNVGMLGQNLSEHINRGVTYFAARDLAKDYLAGNAKAMTFVKKTLDPGWKTELEMLKNPNLEDVTRVFVGHLMDRTQLRYGRVLEAELARELGPVLAAFTKWPTSVLGDMVDKARRGQFIGGTAARWMMPYFALESMDRFMDFDYNDLSDREKRVYYKGGLSEFAPITSLNPILTGQILRSPASGLLLDMAKEVEKSDTVPQAMWDSFMAGLLSGAASYGPGAGLLHGIVVEAPTIFDGEPASDEDGDKAFRKSLRYENIFE